MKTKVSLIMMSYLSDVQEGNMPFMSNNARLNFVKFLILKYPNTDTEVSGAEEYHNFVEKHPALSK